MKAWIGRRVTELLGVEDDVVIAYVTEQLDGVDVRAFVFLLFIRRAHVREMPVAGRLPGGRLLARDVVPQGAVWAGP